MFVPYETHAVRGEEAGLVQLHREVEARLAAQAGEQAVGLFQLDYALHRALCERLDIHRRRHIRVGHDGGGV